MMEETNAITIDSDNNHYNADNVSTLPTGTSTTDRHTEDQETKDQSGHDKNQDKEQGRILFHCPSSFYSSLL